MTQVFGVRKLKGTEHSGNHPLLLDAVSQIYRDNLEQNIQGTDFFKCAVGQRRVHVNFLDSCTC
jgi:hypothetical protein